MMAGESQVGSPSEESRRSGGRIGVVTTGIYLALGLRRVVNADARLTRLGGSLMPPEVVAAMAEAASGYVDMHELQLHVGRRLAELTGNEAAFVTTGAAAGLVVATLACTVGADLQAVARMLEGHPPAKNEVVIHRAHRIPYDPAVLLAGARLVEVGNALQTFPWELEAALSERTALVLFVAGDHLAAGALGLAETVAIAHARGVPVVVDAAAQLPPVENLWRFSRDLGADLVVFSGGKELRGPQASGLLVGRADLIEGCRVHGSPHQRLGRPMKVGKEEMVGLLAAVERYLALDHSARFTGFEATVARWLAACADLPGVAAAREFPNEAGQPVPRLRLTFDPAHTDLTGPEAQRRLWEGTPAIAVALAGPHAISLTPDCLDGDDEALVADRLVALLRGR
jgi:L-seryl-tRNA(Ser) seleniumtransferase